MISEQVIPYIGLPHKPGAKGPDAYDCWNLYVHLQETYFGKELPDAPIGDEDACFAIFKEKCQSGEWLQVSAPEHGDCALMRGGRWPHVGTYLGIDGGGILHAMEGQGIIWTRLPYLSSMGFGRTVYYRVIK